METPEPLSGEDPKQTARARFRATTGSVARGYSWLVVKLRFLILAAWLALAIAASLHLSQFGSNSGPIVTLVPSGAPALRTLATSEKLFHVPAQAEFAVVVRSPGGLSAGDLAAVTAQAVRTDTTTGGAVRFALPITNTLKLFPGSRESGTTAVTFLDIDPNLTQQRQTQAAAAYARSLSSATGDTAHQTGVIPGQLRQGILIDNGLALLEICTLVLILGIVGIAYRSLGAPLMVLAAAAVGLVMTVWLLERLQSHGLAVPQELDPVVVALTLGLTTDYAVFLLSGTRNRMRDGDQPRTAVRVTTAHVAPIALTSAVILAGSLLGLLVSSFGLFHDLAPALALTVGVAFVVSLTLVPALLATFGRGAFWPQRQPAAGTVAPAPPAEPHGLTGLITRRPVAAGVVVVCGAILVLATWPVGHLRLGFGQLSDLPASSPEHQAATAAQRGFAAGILSPTTVLVRGSSIARTQPAALDRLQQLIARTGDVGGVLGPADEPPVARLGVFVSSNGDAARYVVVFRDDPLGAAGIDDLQRLRNQIPALAGRAGIHGARFSYAGDTALADQTISAMESDMLRVGLVVLAINFILLAVFLRALLAPLLLLASSVLNVAAALGLTTWLFVHILGYGQLTYYVPFVVAVLLVSLGSDYNIFVVGRIWQEARVRPLPEAVAVAAPRASRAIRIAGLTLAASFGLLALIPLRSFREIAFAMAAGVLLETFLVRALLAPALIALFGRSSIWPRRQLQRAAVSPPEPAGTHASAPQDTETEGVEHAL